MCSRPDELRLVASLARETFGFGRVAVGSLASIVVSRAVARADVLSALVDVADRARELEALPRGGLGFVERAGLGETPRVRSERRRSHGRGHVIIG